MTKLPVKITIHVLANADSEEYKALHDMDFWAHISHTVMQHFSQAFFYEEFAALSTDEIEELVETINLTIKVEGD